MGTWVKSKRSIFCFCIGIVGLSILFSLVSASNVFAQQKIKIGVILQDKISIFQDSFKGFKATLAKAGYGEDKVEYIVNIVNNDMTKVKDLVDSYRAQGAKLIHSSGTGTTLEILKNEKSIPVVFSIVAYKESLDGAAKKFGFGNNYTGALSSTSTHKLIDLALKVKKDIKKVGMIYDVNADNSRREKDSMEAGCQKYGISFVALPFTLKEEIVPKFKEMISQGVDTVFIPKDSSQQAQNDKIAPIIYENNVLSLTTVEGTVKQAGAVVGISAASVKIGELAGEKAIAVLNGAKPSDIEIEMLKNFTIWVNMIAAKNSGIDVPVAMVNLADQVITK